MSRIYDQLNTFQIEDIKSTDIQAISNRVNVMEINEKEMETFNLINKTAGFNDGLPQKRTQFVAVGSAVTDSNPNIVYKTPQNDVNVDHQKVFASTLVATRPHKNSNVQEVLSYEIPSSTEWFFSSQFNPNVFVDISKEFASKIKAIKAYETEIREFPHPRSIEALEVITKRWGSVAGFNFAEAFRLVRMLIK